MKGVRREPDANGWFNDRLSPGEYVKVDPKRTAEGKPLPADWPFKKHYPYWMGCTPNGHTCALGAHKITEHEDGTITVAPSILISTGGGESRAPRAELWHGYLEHGVWRTLS